MDPVYVMRSYIIDVGTYSLAEQAGMFCEVLKEQLGGDFGLFEGTAFTYWADEPYEIDFIWDAGDVRIKLAFMGDPDNSVWSVIGGKNRFRGTIGRDMNESCRMFLGSVAALSKDQ